MALLPPIRRLLLEDFATQKAWIEPLLLIENSFAESIVNVLNKNLTLHDNTSSDVLSITLSSVPGSGATGSNPTANINWAKSIAPKAVIPSQAYTIVGSSSVPAILAGPLGIQWQYVGNAIQLTNLFGIVPTASAQVILTLVVIAG